MIWLAIVLVWKQQTKEIEERRTRNDIWRLRRRLHPTSLPVDQAADTTKRPISELSARIDVRGNPRTALNNRKVPFVDVETMESGRENLDSAKVKVCWAVDKADDSRWLLMKFNLIYSIWFVLNCSIDLPATSTAGQRFSYATELCIRRGQSQSALLFHLRSGLPRSR